MATELPFYKFEVLPYFTGDICLERWELQGIFCNICAFYWSKNCNVSFTVLSKRYPTSEDLIRELIDLDILKTDGEYLSINFLNEQWASKETQKIVNSINGKKGGRPKKENQNETEKKPNGFNFDKRSDNQNESHIDKIIIDNNRKEEESKLIDEILLFFGYSGINHKKQQSLVMGFVHSLDHHERFDFFTKEFKAYCELKKLDGYPHSLDNFLGKQSEAFADGKWDDNWKERLLLYKIKNGIAVVDENAPKKETVLEKKRRRDKELADGRK